MLAWKHGGPVSVKRGFGGEGRSEKGRSGTGETRLTAGDRQMRNSAAVTVDAVMVACLRAERSLLPSAKVGAYLLVGDGLGLS